ncbi:sensor histidine kinase [Saccharospirillum mangrovi]|uniref:sensor histidine kinase n=1 Tax=Saccharospirillum mangrovi TaxID=2161747 RepID=UPI000D3CD2CC|nr:ATP-binding protein [Saccharospirillum mangrovi]
MLRSFWPNRNAWLLATTLPILVTLLGVLPGSWLNQSTHLLLYLMVALVCALWTGWAGVLICAFLGFALFNFFHTEPRFSFQMHDAGELAAALAYVFFSLLAGWLAYQLRSQVTQLQFQEAFLKAQLRLMARLQQGDDLAVALSAFSDECVLGQLRLFPAPGERDAHTGARALRVEVLDDHRLPASWPTLVRGLGEQVQTALERDAAAAELKSAERQADEERLRSALLSSVSHDLKTPLVTMMGSATSLRDLHADLSEQDRLDLLDSIIDESQRLEGYIQNLLDMTRLGQGGLSLNRQWVSVEELYPVVARRLSQDSLRQRLRFEPEADLPSLWVHAALVEQALYNAVDNAFKASPPDGLVVIRARRVDDWLELDVCDQGKGLPRDQWEAVFEQFYSFSRGDRYEKGSGLGLTICRGMMRVHGGEARIVPAPEGFGHCLRLSLPLVQTGEPEEKDE